MLYYSSPYQNVGRHYYMGRLIGEVMPYDNGHHLARFGRDVQENPDLLLAALGIQPGMVVADIGTGVGFNALRLARLVGPYGRVYATDIQPAMLSHMSYNAALSGLSNNIVPVLSTHYDANLPPNSCDLILVVDTYHECIHPPSVLNGLRQALKPNGRLVLVEYRLENHWAWNMQNDHRMSFYQAKMEFESNGFYLSDYISYMPLQHVLIFRKM